MKMTYLSTPSMIGVDIQPNEMRLVKLLRKKQVFYLEWALTCAIPEDAVKNGKIYSWEQVTIQLSDLVKNRVLSGRAAIAIPANLVRMKNILLPIGLSDTEITAEIEAHVLQDLSGVKEALCIDYVSAVRNEIGYVDVFFVAMKREVLSHYVTCVNASGLQAKIVDVDIYALTRAVSWVLPEILLREHYLVLYYSGQQAIFLAIHQKEIIFHQTWVVAGHEDLSILLQRSIQFYLNNYPKNHAKRLILCSQYTDLNQVVSSLQLFYAFDIFYPDIFYRFLLLNKADITLMTPRPWDFLVALGLAMREVSIW
jgi:type IV pilus assembly protein PilM